MRTNRHGFDKGDMDTSIRPQDDFYRYANGGWLARTVIPDTESTWGSFVELARRVEKQLHTLLTELDEKKHCAHGSPEQLIRDFYRSGMDVKRRNSLGSKPLAPWREQLASMSNYDDLERVIASFHRVGVGALWGVGIDQDSKNSRLYAMHMVQDGLGLPDRDYYLKNDAESTRIRAAYVLHIARVFRLMGYSAAIATRYADQVLILETKLARLSMDKVSCQDPHKTYHKKSLAELQRIAPQVNWKRYFARLGAPRLRTVIVMQPAFVRDSVRMLHHIPIDEWRVYLEWHLAASFAGYLSQPFIRATFDFYGRVLTGRKKMKPLWRQVLGAVNGNVGELLGRLYVRDYFSTEAKRRMHTLVDDLFAAYERRIMALDWMGMPTKRRAVSKLRAMHRKIGYPNRWRPLRIEVRPDDYLGNAVRAGEHEHRRQMRKLSRPVDRDEWFMDPQMVNAYFAPSMNDIVFPAAILQPPFFDVTADDAWNYGAIGAVIGHEITHGFDDHGSKFDSSGNLKDWWTAVDRSRFDKKTRILKRQFDRYEVEPGVSVNGSYTLSENIADLGGAAIAYDAYQQRLASSGRKDIHGLTPEQRFFLAFARAECELARPEYLRTQVLVDSHSPSEFRVNGPVSNMPEFYSAWNVKKGDKLYRSPAQRAKIW